MSSSVQMDEGAGGTGVFFDVWGCRGSRNIVPPRSAIGSHTSSYSLLSGGDLYVFDAGRGLGALSFAVSDDPRFASVERIFILVTHGHMDHWEGLKDADWFWRPLRPLQISVLGTQQTLDTIRGGYQHPAYVALEMLAVVTSQTLTFQAIEVGQELRLGAARVATYALNHFSGHQHDRSHIETIGFRVELDSGATVAYFSDHMPDEETAETEQRVLTGARLAVFDSHYGSIAEQNFGHGSQEYSARIARQHPQVVVLAGHHGAGLSDDDIRASWERYSKDAGNFRLAIEGETYRWNGESFQPL